MKKAPSSAGVGRVVCGQRPTAQLPARCICGRPSDSGTGQLEAWMGASQAGPGPKRHKIQRPISNFKIKL